MTKKTEFLGLELGTDGIGICEDRKKNIKDWPVPRNLTELRGFIGLLKNFKRFVRHFSHIAVPLTKLTRKGSGLNKWDDQSTKAFQDLKDALCCATIMQSPNLDKHFRWHVDASAFAVGGTLTQLDSEGHYRAVA